MAPVQTDGGHHAREALQKIGVRVYPDMIEPFDAKYYEMETQCHAQQDGDCDWEGCPQTRDGEPKRSGRHCPLDSEL